MIMLLGEKKKRLQKLDEYKLYSPSQVVFFFFIYINIEDRHKDGTLAYHFSLSGWHPAVAPSYIVIRNVYC